MRISIPARRSDRFTLAAGLAASCAIACICAASAVAEDGKAVPLAIWAFGDGTLDGRAATLTAPVNVGQPLVAGANNAVRLDLTGFTDSRIILSAGCVASLGVEPGDKPDSKRLVVQLDRGSVQVDVNGTGPYESLRVRGVAADVRVNGTLFVVERVQRDTDFVALVKGRLKVGLRKSVAEALNRNEEVELGPRQGVAVGINGVGSVVALNNRPNLPTTAAAAAAASIQDKTTGVTEGDGNWERDLALAVTMAGFTAPGTDPLNPGLTSIEAATAAALAEAALREAATVAVLDEVSAEIGKQVLQELNLGGAVLNDIIQTLSAGELAGPPPPPK